MKKKVSFNVQTYLLDTFW